jgi:hypothetical protein
MLGQQYIVKAYEPLREGDENRYKHQTTYTTKEHGAMKKISERFLQALRDTGKPLHKVAWEAKLTPNQVYRITAGVDRPGEDDPRINSLCEYLKIPVSYAFEDDPKETQTL